MSVLQVDRVMVTPNMLATFADTFAPLHAVGIDVIYNEGVYPMAAAELADWLGDTSVALIGLDEVTGAVIDACPRLRVIARNGVGMDNVDLEAVTQRGVLVTAPLGANSTSVAELTLGLMITLVRHVLPIHRMAQSDQWRRITGIELAGKTLGIIGLGRIGKKVARRAQAFNMTVVAHDILPDTYFAREHCIAMLTLYEVLSQSDVISLHVPLTDQTRHMIDTEALDHMRSGSYLINIARGDIVDQSALTLALDDGLIGGAALDVHPIEGHVDEALRHRDNVITTTHLGAYTIDSLRYTTERAVQSILDIVNGKQSPDLVNPAAWGTGRL